MAQPDQLPRFDVDQFDGPAARWSPSDNAQVAGLLLRSLLVFQGTLRPPAPVGLAAGLPPPPALALPAPETTP
jgi:hypothetical protein